MTNETKLGCLAADVVTRRETANEKIAREGVGLFLRAETLCDKLDELKDKTIIDMRDNADDVTEINEKDLVLMELIRKKTEEVTGRDRFRFFYLPTNLRYNKDEHQFFFLVHTGDNGSALMSGEMKKVTDIVEYIEKNCGWCSIVDFSNDIPDNLQVWLLTFTN